jgi:hypothetical protein
MERIVGAASWQLGVMRNGIINFATIWFVKTHSVQPTEDNFVMDS